MFTVLSSKVSLSVVVAIIAVSSGFFVFQNCSPTRFQSTQSDFSSLDKESLPPDIYRCDNSDGVTPQACETDRFIGTQLCVDTTTGPTYGVCQPSKCKPPFVRVGEYCEQVDSCINGTTMVCESNGVAGVRSCSNNQWSQCQWFQAKISSTGFVARQWADIKSGQNYVIELQSNQGSVVSAIPARLNYLSGLCNQRVNIVPWLISTQPNGFLYGQNLWTVTSQELTAFGGCQYDAIFTAKTNLESSINLNFLPAGGGPTKVCTPGTNTSTSCPAIANGLSEKSCNAAGTAYGTCVSSCRSGFIISGGTQPNITCVAAVCNNGATNYPVCNTCPVGYYNNGTVCARQVCSPGQEDFSGCPVIGNGKSVRVCNTNGSAYGACLSTCNINYVPAGTQPNISCAPAACGNGATNPPTCTTCATGFNNNGTQCVPQVCLPNSNSSTGCPTIANGSSLKQCNSNGSALGTCVSACEANYNLSGTQPNVTCTLKSCSNGATNFPTCNSCLSGFYFNGSICTQQQCTPSQWNQSGCPNVQNGTNQRQCNAQGSGYGICDTTCSTGFTRSGTSPNFVCLANSCGNGAINPPASGGNCTVCPANQYYDASTSRCKARVCTPNQEVATGCPTISNGRSVKTCNADGSALGACVSSCLDGHVQSGTQPNISCSVPACSNGAINYPECKTCGTGYYYNGSACIIQACAPSVSDLTGCTQVAHGKSERQCSASGSGYGDCVSSCSGGFTLSGVYPNAVCLANSCGNGATNPPVSGGNCTLCPADKYYEAASASCKAKVCDPNSSSQSGCSVLTNGTNIKTCNGQGSGYGSCVAKCNDGYTQSGTAPYFSCLANSCSNGAINPPSQGGTCNTCTSGQTFYGGRCVASCTNGGTNPPECTTCPAGKQYDGSGQCVSCHILGSRNFRLWYDANLRRSVLYDTGIDLVADKAETYAQACKEQMGPDARAVYYQNRGYSSPGDNRVGHFDNGAWRWTPAVEEDGTTYESCDSESGQCQILPNYRVWPYNQNTTCMCGNPAPTPIPEDPCEPHVSPRGKDLRMCP